MRADQARANLVCSRGRRHSGNMQISPANQRNFARVGHPGVLFQLWSFQDLHV
jgi:hypothetical protein